MKKQINFGVGIPTGTEGLMYPVPFAKARDNIRISVEAEKQGYDSVWGNDHVSTQHYVRGEFEQPPNYFSPLLTLAAIAENTTTLRLATALLVVPFRNPVMIAKELATLDQLSNGRVIAGVGLGAYREEFVSMFGEKAKEMHRGTMIDESLYILNRIFKEEVVSYQGKYFDVKEVQSYPRPVQNPFPFYIGGNAANGLLRTAKYGQGWLPAVLSVDEIRAGVEEITKYCNELGRNPEEIDIAPQFAISIGRTHEEAVEQFERTQLHKHLVSLKKSTLKNQQTGGFEERNLIGTPDEVGERIKQYIDAGVTTFSALLFADNTVDEMIESMQFFSEEVMSKFISR
ncbi:LLM class flavin-dependent oxidoreductase [Neobacillus niacini]|uniref:LLM class flavin-dependent oxidoreductase n=1 Tax=Neobacillus niacini TaxID=86668 RepID=UPI003000FFA4